jgi:replication-associated recombination protein RarA
MKPLLHRLTQVQIDAAVPATGGYIFHGVRGIGKALTAREVARRLNCQGDEAGVCVPCRQLEAGTYPDYVVVAPADKPSIGIEQIRSLVQAAALRPYHGNSVRVIVVDEAETLTLEAQNALLKLIEEPPPATRVILIATETERLLPTVRSRMGSIYFAPVPTGELAAWLESTHGQVPARALQLARAAEGAPGVAVALMSEPEALESHQALDDLAVATLSMSRFERLRTARRLVDSKADLWLLAGRLQRVVVARIHGGTDSAAEAARRLAALELFRRQLVANVGAKVAVERLMLEL